MQIVQVSRKFATTCLLLTHACAVHISTSPLFIFLQAKPISFDHCHYFWLPFKLSRISSEFLKTPTSKALACLVRTIMEPGGGWTQVELPPRPRVDYLKILLNYGQFGITCFFNMLNVSIVIYWLFATSVIIVYWTGSGPRLSAKQTHKIVHILDCARNM